jgi:uncharacterized protein YmfQ (DUF2313 family)
MTTHLDPARKSADVTLSNGNLTAIKTGTDGTNSWAASTSNGTGITLYAEVHFDASILPSSCGFGIANATESNPAYVGGTPNSFGYFPNGIVYTNGAFAGIAAAYTTGDTLAIAVDLNAQTVRFRNVSRDTTWSSSISIATLGAAAVYCAFNYLHLNDSWTANFDGSFLGVVPGGYTRWDGTTIYQAAVGVLAASESPDVANFTLSVPVSGVLVASEAPDVAQFTGTVSGAGIYLPLPGVGGKYTFKPGEDRHLRRTGDDYANQFLTLLPQGQAWPKEPGSTLYQTCFGLSEYWGFVDGRAGDLLERESDPRKTLELLPDWERAWGLPDPCLPSATTLDERRRMLLFVMRLVGTQSRNFYEQVMEWLGYTITIKEFAPFMAGVSEAGDTRYEYDNTGEFRWEIGPEELRFYWTAEAEMPALIWFRASNGEAGVDHHLEIRTPEELQCLLNRWKPAHTEIIMDMSQLAFGGPMQGTP